MKVSAIIVTYNRLNLLKECLNNLLNQKYKLNNIFIVNNKSTDGTKEYLDNLNNDKIISINSKTNLGGAGGFSLGTKIACEKSDSDYLWLMDDDTMPIKNSLNILVKAANKLNNNFGFLCSNVRWWKDYRPVNLPEVSKNDWSNLLPNNFIKVKKATFVSFFIKRSTVLKIGLPISDMFIWGDDYEYSNRISDHFNSYFVSNCIIIHKCADSSGNETLYNTNRIKNYNYKYRNNLFIAKQYYGTKKVIKELLNDIFIFVKSLIVSKNKRFKRAFCVMNGALKGLLFNPSIHYPNQIFKGKDDHD